MVGVRMVGKSKGIIGGISADNLRICPNADVAHSDILGSAVRLPRDDPLHHDRLFGLLSTTTTTTTSVLQAMPDDARRHGLIIHANDAGALTPALAGGGSVARPPVAR